MGKSKFPSVSKELNSTSFQIWVDTQELPDTVGVPLILKEKIDKQ